MVAYDKSDSLNHQLTQQIVYKQKPSFLLLRLDFEVNWPYCVNGSVWVLPSTEGCTFSAGLQQEWHLPGKTYARIITGSFHRGDP